MDDPKNLVLLVPIVLGIASQFSPFIDTPAAFRLRVSLLYKTLKENLALYLAELLDHARSIQDEPLRGDHNSPDKVLRYTSETWRTFDLLRKVDKSNLLFKIGMFILFLASLIGLILIIALLTIPDQSDLIFRIALIVIAVQIVALIDLFIVCNKFEAYERST